MLNVSRGEGGFGDMVVEIDGKRVRRGNGVQFASKRFGGVRAWMTEGEQHVDLSPSTRKRAEVLEVRAHHLRFTIETKAALKFDSAADQVAFGHLNLRFNGAMLPATSRGLLAQLAGRREVTSHSEERFQLRRNRKAKRQAERLAGLMRKRDAQRASETEHVQHLDSLLFDHEFAAHKHRKHAASAVLQAA